MGLMEEKKIKGRKRQLAVDSGGLLHRIFVHQANIPDSKGGAILADLILTKCHQVKMVVVDLGYRGFFAEVVKELHHRVVEFSNKIVGEFVVQPKRWIVERTIAWLNWARR